MLDISNVFKTVSYNYNRAAADGHGDADLCTRQVKSIFAWLNEYYAEIHIVSEQFAFGRIDTAEATRRGNAIDEKYIKIFNRICAPGDTDGEEG